MTTSTQSAEVFAEILWRDVQKELAVAIIGTIRTMGLPTPEGGDGHRPKERHGRQPGASEVRFALLNDCDLQDGIVDQVKAEFRQAVARGSIKGNSDRRLVFRIIQCVTWKRAHARSLELFRTVSASEVYGNDAALVSEEPLPDEQVEREEIRARLDSVLARLTPEDRRLLLEGKAEEGYGELAKETGVEVGALRVRAYRLWKKVKAEVLGEE